jgi:hypothetical protein
MYLGLMTEACSPSKDVASPLKQPRVIRLTKSGGRLNQRIKNRLQVKGRTADGFQDFGSGCLLLKCFP